MSLCSISTVFDGFLPDLVEPVSSLPSRNSLWLAVQQDLMEQLAVPRRPMWWPTLLVWCWSRSTVTNFTGRLGNAWSMLSISINIYQYVGSQKFHPKTCVHLGLQLQTVLALNHGILVLPCRFYSRLLRSDSPLREWEDGLGDLMRLPKSSQESRIEHFRSVKHLRGWQLQWSRCDNTCESQLTQLIIYMYILYI